MCDTGAVYVCVHVCVREIVNHLDTQTEAGEVADPKRTMDGRLCEISTEMSTAYHSAEQRPVGKARRRPPVTDLGSIDAVGLHMKCRDARAHHTHTTTTTNDNGGTTKHQPCSLPPFVRSWLPPSPEAFREQGCAWRTHDVNEQDMADGVTLLGHHTLQVPCSQGTGG